MKILSKIGNALAASAIFMSLNAIAGECKTSTPDQIISHELKTERNLICIVRNNGKAVIFIYRDNDYISPYAKNTTLLDESDLTDDIVRLEPSNDGFKIYLEYPNNIYLLGFDVDARRVVESNVLIRISGFSPNTPPQQLHLSLTSEQRARLKFDTLAKEDAFDQELLSLQHPLNVVITTKNSKISHSPNIFYISDKYLTHGAQVKIIAFKNGWVKIQGSPSQNNRQVGWIPIADVL
jgi:hypothetical protein